MYEPTSCSQDYWTNEDYAYDKLSKEIKKTYPNYDDIDVDIAFEIMLMGL